MTTYRPSESSANFQKDSSRLGAQAVNGIQEIMTVGAPNLEMSIGMNREASVAAKQNANFKPR